MPDRAPFDTKKFLWTFLPLSGGWWGKAINQLWRLIFMLILIAIIASGVLAIKERIFPTKKPATSKTVLGDVQEGAVVNVTNVNNPAPELKQGIYGKIASDRATVGVFKEVMPNIDISLGAGQDFDEDVVVESEVRFKF